MKLSEPPVVSPLTSDPSTITEGIPGGTVGVAVAVGVDPVGVGPIELAEDLPGGPLVLLAQDLMIEVLEELKLDRVAETLGWLEAVNHDPARAAHEL